MVERVGVDDDGVIYMLVLQHKKVGKMKVKDLIEALQQVKDKDKNVLVESHRGWQEQLDGYTETDDNFILTGKDTLNQ